jgi:hypothetical protein
LETGISRWYDFAGDLNFLCGSLIRFDGLRGEINLIHQTAKEFLETFVANSSLEDVEGLDMDVQAANAHLASICVQYLLRNEEFLELERIRRSSQTSPSYLYAVAAFLRRYPFLCYAIECWASHARGAGTPSPVLSNMIYELLLSARHRDGIMTLTYYINYHGSFNVPLHQHPIHLAAYFNLPWLVERYISEDENAIDAVCTTNDTALVWASEMGSTECAKKLLDAGADPNIYEVDGWSALHWAARNGHLKVAEFLVDHGARLGQPDHEGHIPLDWAIGREHWEVVSFLERRTCELMK